MSTAIARNLMAEMKLLGMLGAFDKLLHDATRDQSSYSELLDALLQAEADYRQERKTGYRTAAGVRGHRLHRQSLDHQDADQRALQSAVAARCASGALDRPDRRRQDLSRSGRRTARLCLRQIGAVHDLDHLAGESRSRALQRRLPQIPRQTGQA